APGRQVAGDLSQEIVLGRAAEKDEAGPVRQGQATTEVGEALRVPRARFLRGAGMEGEERCVAGEAGLRQKGGGQLTVDLGQVERGIRVLDRAPEGARDPEEHLEVMRVRGRRLERV